MEIQKDIADVRKQYEEIIKPLIEEGDYQIAGFEMINLTMTYLQPNARQIMRYHSGPNFLGSTSILEKNLMSENIKPEGAIERFEAYLAQLELSIKSGNRCD